MDLSIQNLKAQTYFYSFFSTFFREKPSNEWLKSALELVASWDETCSPLHQQFSENIQKSGLDNYLNTLSQEYERLFFAPGHVLVNLYESVYCGSGLLMQETTVNVRQHYLRAGLVVKSLYSIPDDHIATELEFMQFLSQKIFELVQQDGVEEAIQEIMVWQSEFISEHLQQWIPTLAETIRAKSTEPFFQLMSIGLESLVEE
ncbi:molecular chaperone [Desulfosporosinus sp. BICA1-9]|uniref:TorD/DmsD family molecular chaperone n=1 Tax=Desulfosporosinus sp. BICA1-9 TaxID=1531958 RepID=UPI00054BF8EE|nr:molecular chaperone TorD family protein [Desulfosporosinus sp. BICA1-9]KJS49207.1 MAG: hypothetical protein VR66_09725 [Peptococcaceae bacterium BRH_c23]KJS84769.1 MAG: hypothetical protein JL57_20270 [Desulfosporosinus sp. BICA1-9]HBW34795.1 hypothetical protein [Desulfosporosinus sp.]